MAYFLNLSFMLLLFYIFVYSFSSTFVTMRMVFGFAGGRHQCGSMVRPLHKKRIHLAWVKDKATSRRCTPGPVEHIREGLSLSYLGRGGIWPSPLSINSTT